ncbi:MAG TPA: hypothetical protein VHS53_09400 [Mucilaginibacter sp.]|nr:hypothetical protein [Mucilaginibacter sp.]
MVRTIITPDKTDVHLSIPPNYVGRQIEVMYYPVDELTEEKQLTTKTMSAFKGILSEAEGNELQEYVRKSREEWDRGI